MLKKRVNLSASTPLQLKLLLQWYGIVEEIRLCAIILVRARSIVRATRVVELLEFAV